MSDPKHPFTELLERDKRYRFDAYVFVFEALRYAQEVLGLGTETATNTPNPGETPGGASARSAEESSAAKSSKEAEDDEDREERHLTGQELCEAIRLYALEQYGYMAKSVLNHWGIEHTKDFGEIVFNLIEIGQMRKTPGDRREDFCDVFDFDAGFRRDFQITLPD